MNDPKPSQGLSIFAALVPLATVPLGLGLFAVGTRGRLVEAFLEGGPMMYAALGAAVVAGLGAAVAVYLASRISARAAGAVPALGLLILAVGAFGYRLGMSGSLEAVVHASPMDRGRIMCAAAAEVSWLVVLPLVLMGALVLASGAGFLLAALARRGDDPTSRRGLLVVGAGSLPLGAFLLAAAWAELLGGEMFRALAHAAPMDKLFIFLGTLEERAGARTFELGAAGAVVLVALLGALWLRANAAAAAGVAAYLLLALVGAQGARSLSRVTSEARALITEGLTVAPLLDLDAGDTEGFSGLVLDGDGLVRNGRPLEHDPDRLTSLVRDGALSVGLGAHTTKELLGGLLDEALKQRIGAVDLVGVHTRQAPAGITVPPWLDGALTTYRAVRVRLVRGEDCQAPCPLATVTEHDITTPDGAWPLVDQSEVFAGIETNRPPVYVDFRGLEPKLLLRLANTVAARDHQLVLVSPAPEYKPSEHPNIDDDARGGLAGEVTLTPEMVARLAAERSKEAPGTARGTLAPELIRQVADHNLGQVKSCYEKALRDNPALTGTVRLAFTIGSTGAVTHAKAVSTAHDAQLETCLVRRLMTWVFPRPKGGPVDVTYPFSFAQAQ